MEAPEEELVEAGFEVAEELLLLLLLLVANLIVVLFLLLFLCGDLSIDGSLPSFWDNSRIGPAWVWDEGGRARFSGLFPTCC